MKAKLTLFIVALFIISCQPSQYTESSPEIDLVKTMLEAYEAGDWDAFKAGYSDTAAVYHNTVEPITVDEAVAALSEQLTILTEYGFNEDVEFEFVTTDAGEQWASWWAVWEGTMQGTNAEFSIPVHVSQRFVDGKIVEEWGYWDNFPLATAAMELAAQAAAEDAQSDE